MHACALYIHVACLVALELDDWSIMHWWVMRWRRRRRVLQEETVVGAIYKIPIANSSPTTFNIQLGTFEVSPQLREATLDRSFDDEAIVLQCFFSITINHLGCAHIAIPYIVLTLLNAKSNIERKSFTNWCTYFKAMDKETWRGDNVVRFDTNDQVITLLRHPHTIRKYSCYHSWGLGSHRAELSVDFLFMFGMEDFHWRIPRLQPLEIMGNWRCFSWSAAVESF